jgi:hypothetical protein
MTMRVGRPPRIVPSPGNETFSGHVVVARGTADRGWTFDREHGCYALGLHGTGALRLVTLRGVLTISRGGVWLHSRDIEHAPPLRLTLPRLELRSGALN